MQQQMMEQQMEGVMVLLLVCKLAALCLQAQVRPTGVVCCMFAALLIV
jgi:hypothetical protein